MSTQSLFNTIREKTWPTRVRPSIFVSSPQNCSSAGTPVSFYTELYARSTQRECDRLLCGQRHAFRPCQFIRHIPKVSACAGQCGCDMLLCDLFERRANTDPQGLGCRQELNRLFVAPFPFVD